MNHLGGKASAYSRVRLWGSVGFIVAVVGLGYLFDIVDIWWLLPSMTFLLSGIWLSSLVIPEKQVNIAQPHLEPFLKVVMRPEVLVFLLVCFLMQASHGPYYTFYSIYLDGYSYSKATIGWLWALGVFCEIGIFIWLHRLQKWISLKWIMLWSIGLAVLRWLLIGWFPESLTILIVAQILHAVTFGAYHATAVEMVHGFFVGRHQTRGQAIYGSISFGLGGALGSFYAGLTWSQWGPGSTFTIAAVLAAVAMVFTAVWIKPRT